MKKDTIVKLLSIGLAVVMLGGCGNAGTSAPASSSSAAETSSSAAFDISKITIDDVVKANSYETLLSRHKNWSMVTNIKSDDSLNGVKLSGKYGESFYVEKDCLYYDVDAYKNDGDHHLKQYVLSNNLNSYYFSGDLKMGIYFFAMPDGEKKEKRNKLNICPESAGLFVYNENEVYGSIKDNGDGTLTLSTHANLIDTYNPKMIPEEWKDAKKELTYILNKDNLEVQKTTTVIVSGEKTYDFESIEYSFDTDKPEPASKLLDMTKEYESGTPKDPMSVKIVYNSGTDKEETFSTTFDKAVSIRFITRDGYSLFADPAGKQALSRLDNGMTIYAVKK